MVSALIHAVFFTFAAAAGPSQSAGSQVVDLTEKLMALSRQYQKLDPSNRPRLLKELRNVAAERKKNLSRLMQTNPGELPRVALPVSARAGMPAALKGYLEEEVELVGELEILVEDRDTGGRYLYFLQTPSERLSLYFAADPPEYVTGTRVHVSGLRVGGDVAIQSRKHVQPR